MIREMLLFVAWALAVVVALLIVGEYPTPSAARYAQRSAIPLPLRHHGI